MPVSSCRCVLLAVMSGTDSTRCVLLAVMSGTVILMHFNVCEYVLEFYL